MLDVLYDTDGDGKDDNLVQGFKYRLRPDHDKQFSGRDQSGEGDREKDQGIGALTDKGRYDRS